MSMVYILERNAEDRTSHLVEDRVVDVPHIVAHVPKSSKAICASVAGQFAAQHASDDPLRQ